MENRFDAVMAKKSDFELASVLIKESDYQPEAVEAAKKEMRKRNLTKEQLDTFAEEIHLQELNSKQKQKRNKNAFIFLLSELISPSFNFWSKDIEEATEKGEHQSSWAKFIHYLYSPIAIINSLAAAIIIRVVFKYDLFNILYFLIKEQEYGFSLGLLLFSAFQIGVAIALFKRNKIGWVLLNLGLALSMLNSIYVYGSWLITDGYIPDFFSWKVMENFILYLILPMLTCYYIHTRKILNIFKINRKSRIISLVLSIFIGIIYIAEDVYALDNGYKIYYYDSGAMQSEGNLESGRCKGEWKFWFEDGTVQAVQNFKEGILHGSSVGYDANGAVVESGQYLNGLQSGLWIYYYPSGFKRSEAFFLKGRKTGKWIWYYESNVKSDELYYDQDKEDGTHYSWFENGNFKMQGSYQKGKKVGTWTYWYPDNTKQYVIDCKDGVEYIIDCWDKHGNQMVKEGNGTFKSLYDNNVISQEGSIKQGSRAGIWKEWYENGKLKSITEWDSTMALLKDFWSETGEHIIVDGNGEYLTPYEQGQYKNGKKEGLWITYNEMDQSKAEMEYNNGLLHGSYRYLTSTGEIKMEGAFMNNKREGLWTRYYYKGAPESQVEYINDKKSGTQIFWDEQGNLLKEEYYNDGEFRKETVFNSLMP